MMDPIYAQPKTPIKLGYVGEEEHREVVFPLCKGADSANVCVTYGEVFYYVGLTKGTDGWHWVVTSADLGKVSCRKVCQVTYLCGDVEIGKTCKYTIHISSSIDGVIADPPDPVEEWYETMQQDAATCTEQAEAAEASATAAAASEAAAASSASTATTKAAEAAASETVATQKAAAAANSASASAASATESKESATAAAASETAAKTAQAAAESARNTAQTYRDNASNSASSAASSAATASSMATTATNAKTAAETARDKTLVAQTAAETAASKAASSQTAAASSATAASSSQTAAATSETNAAASATEAASSAESIAESAAQIAQNTADIESLNDDLADTNKSLDALWKLSEGQVYDFVEQTESGTNVAPSGAKYWSVEEAYGKSTQGDNPSPDNPQPITDVTQEVFTVTAADGTQTTHTMNYTLRGVGDVHDVLSAEGIVRKIAAITYADTEGVWKTVSSKPAIVIKEFGDVFSNNGAFMSNQFKYASWTNMIFDHYLYCGSSTVDELNAIVESLDVRAKLKDACYTTGSISTEDSEYLASLDTLSTDYTISVVDQNGNDISYLVEYIVKLSEVG